MALPCLYSTASLCEDYKERKLATSNEDNRPTETAPLASAFPAFRELVLERWRVRVAAEIPAAASLDQPVLVNMVPTLYDYIADALARESPVASANTGTNLAAVHGRERANMTDYSPHDVIHELQIFREVLFSITKSQGMILSKHDADVIGHSIEEAARESINGFSDADRQKSVDFIASLSHDLRNPLHVASVTAQLIQLKTADDNITTMAKRIHRKIGETDAMIQTLLDAAVLKGRMKLKLHIVQFDIMSLVEEVCADLPLLGQSVEVSGESIEGHWCRVSMKRVLENLISNAQKYGDPAQAIRVRVGRVDDRMLLSVHNEGKPIPETEINRLFNTFQRMENVQVKGWGLGLPFVQNVVESHGGSAIVDSAEGRGTTFTVNIPVDPRPLVQA